MDQQNEVRDLSLEQLEVVAGGTGWLSQALAALTDVLRWGGGGGDTASTALNADLGIRG